MENKYYTPQIEEFRAGFEYIFKHENGDIFCTYGGNGPWDWDTIEELKDCLSRDLIKIKYLDSEDIESIETRNSEGFTTYLKLREVNKKELIFQTYWKEENAFLDEEYIYWDIEYNQIKITHKSKTLFWGEIKNKSELKVLLNQLGIKYL